MKKNEMYFTVTGRRLWDGRFACVCGVVFSIENDEVFVLANKRGPGCPDYVGMWNMPCGYLDAGSGEENTAREVFEETGLDIVPEMFHFLELGDLATNRNVTLRYMAVVPKVELPSVESLTGGEENEVEEIKWIPISDIDNYQWAFNHYNIIKDYANRKVWC